MRHERRNTPRFNALLKDATSAGWDVEVDTWGTVTIMRPDESSERPRGLIVFRCGKAFSLRAWMALHGEARCIRSYAEMRSRLGLPEESRPLSQTSRILLRWIDMAYPNPVYAGDIMAIMEWPSARIADHIGPLLSRGLVDRPAGHLYAYKATEQGREVAGDLGMDKVHERARRRAAKDQTTPPPQEHTP